MSKLAELKSRLARLRRMRRTARLSTACGGMLLAVLWLLAGMFAVDWLLEMTRGQRVVMLVIGAGVLLWAFRRYAAPWLRHGESLLDVALLVERQQEIDSDLVAALQFETPEAHAWGSPQLEQAVIDYVAEFGQGMNVMEGLDRRQMTRRLALCCATLAAVALVVVAAPRHTSAFLQRLALSSIHYPSETQLHRVVINGQEVRLLPASRITAKCPYGEPLNFEVLCGGKLPEDGRVELRTEGGLETTVALARGTGETGEMAATSSKGASPPALVTTVSADASANGGATYQGQLPRLVDTVYCQFYLGDLWTEPARIEVIPLPKVEFQLRPVPPEYARGVEKEKSDGSSRHISVIAGSRVELDVECENKRLAKAVLVVEEEEYPLLPRPESGDESNLARKWQLPLEGTPLDEVRAPLTYEIAAEDEDGLVPMRPIQGSIRIMDDRPPRIFGRVAVRRVVPDAEQEIEFEATDDFGLARLRLRVQALRAEEMPDKEAVYEIHDFPEPRLRRRTDDWPLRGNYLLHLSPFSLSKGDRLQLVLEATDYRGSGEGITTQSEPISLIVTDQSGVLADLTESDEKLLEEFGTIINLNVGDKQ